jgi:hypothetical protein
MVQLVRGQARMVARWKQAGAIGHGAERWVGDPREIRNVRRAPAERTASSSPVLLVQPSADRVPAGRQFFGPAARVAWP